MGHIRPRYNKQIVTVGHLQYLKFTFIWIDRHRWPFGQIPRILYFFLKSNMSTKIDKFVYKNFKCSKGKDGINSNIILNIK